MKWSESKKVLRLLPGEGRLWKLLKNATGVSDGKPPICIIFCKTLVLPNDFEVTPITVKYSVRLRKKLLISWRKVGLGRYTTSLAKIKNISKVARPTSLSHRGKLTSSLSHTVIQSYIT